MDSSFRDTVRHRSLVHLSCGSFLMSFTSLQKRLNVIYSGSVGYCAHYHLLGMVLFSYLDNHIYDDMKEKSKYTQKNAKEKWNQ